MCKRFTAFVCAFALIFSLSARAAGMNLSGLDALMEEKKAGAVQGGKAAALALLTGGSQDVRVGVVLGGLVRGCADEKHEPAGFDVELVAAVMDQAKYANYSFVFVEEEAAVSRLDSGDVQLLMGYTMDDEALARVTEAIDTDAVAKADAELDMEAESGATAASEDEQVLTVGEAEYIKTKAYLSGKGKASYIDGATIDLQYREFYLIGKQDMAKVISAFDNALEKVDIAGTKDALWKAYFKTGFMFSAVSAVRRFFLNIWRQFRLNLITERRYRMIFTGLGRTLLIALCATCVGVVLGSFLALMRLSNFRIGRFYILRGIASVYVDVIRGTPVVVQLMIMYYIILNSPDISKITVAIVSFGLNSGAYVSEMVRGGILAVDKGQTEAGRSLGLSSAATMCLIVLPQTIKIIIPSLFNEIIMLLKETSVVGFIGLMDLTKAGDYIRSRTYSAFFPLLTVAAVYLIIVTVLTRVFNRIERRLRQSDIR